MRIRIELIEDDYEVGTNLADDLDIEGVKVEREGTSVNGFGNYIFEGKRRDVLNALDSFGYHLSEVDIL